MGFISKLFGKKDEFDLEGEPISEEHLGLDEKPVIPETGDSPEQSEGAATFKTGLTQPTAPTELPLHLTEPAPTTAAPVPTQISPRDIELINSKLDTLKAILNSLDQRMANLEKAAGVEHKKMPW